MRTELTNVSPLPREHWAPVTFPRPLAAEFGPECTFVADSGASFRAVRGRTVGMKTVYRIRAYLGGSETVQGLLVNRRFPKIEDYRFHEWVSDDIGALIPSCGARVAGVDRWDINHTAPVLIDSSPAHTRWALRRWIPEVGVVFDWWADILHDDPVMPIWGKIVWSARLDPAPEKVFEFLAIRSGELLALDFAKRNGVVTPHRDPHNMWLHLLNSAPLVFSDGAGLPISGSMLAWTVVPADAPIPDPEDRSHPMVHSFSNLKAALQGPIVGTCLEWDSHWLAAGHVPRFRAGYNPQNDAHWQQFLADQQVPAGWFADRPVGLGKTPSQTGGQEDFGATKGTDVVSHGDPRWIRIAQYAVQSELFRGFNHYEANGAPLNLAQHPNWVTWSGATHYHLGVSPDRLGKNPAGPPATGWHGYDDEHRSQNNLAAYMMLTDDPLMEDQLRHLVTTDRASYRMRFPNNGSGAARAQGRTAGAWAQFLALTDGPEKQHWINIIASRMNASLALNPAINVAGPMKVLAWGGPDPRKQVYKPDGTLGPWTSWWEHGLAIVGIYKAVKQAPGNLQAKEILLRICRTLAQFAFFQHNGTWYTVADCLWSDGAAPPGALAPTNKAMVVTAGAGDVNTWTFAGLLVAREVLWTDPQTTPETIGRLTSYITAITGGQEANNAAIAEWWAIVDTIQFPMPS